MHNLLIYQRSLVHMPKQLLIQMLLHGVLQWIIKREFGADGVFEEVELPQGECVIGLKWVYDYKTIAKGVNIKKKAQVVAQGFSQQPGQFDETYKPVAKMASICILLTWTAVHNLDIFQFDCKTAFLHARIRHPIYTHQFPGYTLADPTKVLRICVALYGLHQSAYKFYTLIMSLMISLGMVCCC
jgi:Reverse transcriptase (RNA-dependent DNA polymerase)